MTYKIFDQAHFWAGAQLGRLLDYFDEHDMWSDTALVITTDHGYLLGEHDWWAKVRMPAYNEVANIPLFIHHPDFASMAGERRKSLTQTIDLMPTMLDLHGIEPPPEVEGVSLINLLKSDTKVREAALYGVWGSAANITDGRYTYFRYPDDLDNQEIFQYTLMPMHAMSLFAPDVLRNAELVEPFDFTKGAPLLKIPGRAKTPTSGGLGMPNRSLAKGFFQDNDTVLFDIANDPNQTKPLDDPAVIERLTDLMVDLMKTNDAPAEVYRRFGLE